MTKNRTSLSEQFTKTNLVMAILVALLGIFSFWLNTILTEYFLYNDVSIDDLQEIYDTLILEERDINWDLYNLPQNSYAEVLNQEYTVLAASKQGHLVGYQYSVRIFNEAAGSPDVDMIAYYPYEDDHEMLVMFMPLKTYLIPYQATLISLCLFMIGLFSIVKVLSAFSAKQLITPIEQLSSVVHNIKSGDYGTTITLNAGNDLDQLAGDINDLSQAIDHEIKLRESLEDSRQQLILDISHDLKTPLTNIIGYSESMSGSLAFDEVEQKSLEAIIRNGKRANHLLNDLFTYSKLNASKYTLDLHIYDLKLMFEDFIATCIPDIDTANKSYVVDLENDEYPVLIDIQMFRRVFENIVDNFIRYSGQETCIHFRLKIQSNNAQLDISDDGLGIPDLHKHNIFDAFYRADTSRSTQTGGSGLGLSITKKIIELHGGTIELMPTNVGTHFRINLPLT